MRPLCSCGTCKRCKWRAYYTANKTDRNEASRRYYAENLEARRAAHRRYYAANREARCAAARRGRDKVKARERARLYREKNALAISAREHERYLRRRDAVLAKHKALRASKPEKLRARDVGYRERLNAGLVQPHPTERRHFYPQQVVRVGVPGWGARP